MVTGELKDDEDSPHSSPFLSSPSQFSVFPAHRLGAGKLILQCSSVPTMLLVVSREWSLYLAC